MCQSGLQEYASLEARPLIGLVCYSHGKHCSITLSSIHDSHPDDGRRQFLPFFLTGLESTERQAVASPLSLSPEMTPKELLQATVAGHFIRISVLLSQLLSHQLFAFPAVVDARQ